MLSLALFQLLNLLLVCRPLPPCPGGIKGRQIDNLAAHPISPVQRIQLRRIEQLDDRLLRYGLVLPRAQHGHEVLPRIADAAEITPARRWQMDDVTLGHYFCSWHTVIAGYFLA